MQKKSPSYVEMSNSANINKLNSVLLSLWELELNEYYLGKADVLSSAIQTLQVIREEMIVEREKRIASITSVVLPMECCLKSKQT
jgi:general stress protein 26